MRAKRRSEVSGFSASTASDSDRLDRNGNGCTGSTASGVSTGKTARRKYARAHSRCVGGQLAEAAHADLVLAQLGQELVQPERHRRLRQAHDERANPRQLFDGGQAIRRRARRLRLQLLVQARDANHEKLVQIRAEDGQELQPLEHWPGAIARLIEHALVERKPAELAVEVKLGVGQFLFVVARFGRHGSVRCVRSRTRKCLAFVRRSCHAFGA